MPVTSYHSLSGRIRGESSQGARTDYLSDALGSVTATADQTGAVGNTYRAKPYGATLARSGAGADPRFLWAGETGSRSTGLSGAEQYNRARHYGSVRATWTSVDLSSVRSGRSGTSLPGANPLGMRPLGQLGTCDLAQTVGIGIASIPMPPSASLGNCGSWGDPENYKIRWDIQGLRTRTSSDGWIIQEIENPAYSMTSCAGKPTCSRPLIHYWEGWYVQGNSVLVTSAFYSVAPPHDYFSDPDQCSCHTGKKIRRGHAKFYPVDRQCWKQWGWTDGRGFKSDPRGVLLGGAAPMNWNRNAAVLRTITAEVNCCDSIPTPDCPSSYCNVTETVLT